MVGNETEVAKLVRDWCFFTSLHFRLIHIVTIAVQAVLPDAFVLARRMQTA